MVIDFSKLPLNNICNNLICKELLKMDPSDSIGDTIIKYDGIWL